MGNDEEIEGKGFVIRDRRRFTEEGDTRQAEEPGKAAESGEAMEPGTETREEAGQEAGRSPEKEAASAEKQQRASETPLPEINFSTFIFSLNTSALLHLGEYPDPTSGKKETDLQMAKQTIDLIGMLEEKTRGNLTTDEENLIKHILYDLRLRYVQKSK